MKSWPHAPLHAFNSTGTYMVTGATMYKQHFFRGHEALDIFHDLLLDLANKYGWGLEAWAVFSNHYHFIAQSPGNPLTLKKFITHLHASSARVINQKQEAPGRQVWYQYWDTKLTYQQSYLARLKYVVSNPVKHQLVYSAEDYAWCSANWFKTNSNYKYYDLVMDLNIDELNIEDDY